MHTWRCPRTETNLDFSASIVLDDFVRSVVSASPNDPGHVASAIVFLEDCKLPSIHRYISVRLTIEMASSQTSSNHTNSRLQPPPLQYTPSPTVLPMMTLRSVPPRSTTKAVSFSPGMFISLCASEGVARETHSTYLLRLGRGRMWGSGRTLPTQRRRPGRP